MAWIASELINVPNPRLDVLPVDIPYRPIASSPCCLYPIFTHDTSRLGHQHPGSHGIQITNVENVIQRDMELYLDGVYLCMDFCAPQCATAESDARANREDQINVLDDSSAGACSCMGSTTVVFCNGSQGYLQ